MKPEAAWETLQDFYDRHPYPPPVENLDGYRRRWEDENRRRADFHLHWPDRPYRADLHVLVAGCGTSQAAKYALRYQDARVVGIDLSETSIRHTEALRHKYRLDNLKVCQLPVERAGELGRTFDKVICTGVLHHLPDPEAGLRALREVLAPDGALHLMVYALYGRAGIYMLQEYCHRLGIEPTDEEIRNLANTLTALPRDHPLAPLLGSSPDFRTPAGLADALLNPLDRAYTVPELFDLLERSGLTFGRWLHQAPYSIHCGDLSKTPHASRLAELSPAGQYAAVELFRGTMLRHSLIAYRDDRPPGISSPDFAGEHWPGYIPIRLPDTRIVLKRLPAGAAAVLINPTHTYPDLYLPIQTWEKSLLEEIDGRRTIAQVLQAAGQKLAQKPGGAFFERLWWYDQVVFDASESTDKPT